MPADDARRQYALDAVSRFPTESGQRAGLLVVVDIETLRQAIEDAMNARLESIEALLVRAIADGARSQAPASAPRNLLTEHDVATRLGLSTRTVRRLESSGDGFPPALRVRGVRRWEPEAVEAWVEARRAAASGD